LGAAIFKDVASSWQGREIFLRWLASSWQEGRFFFYFACQLLARCEKKNRTPCQLLAGNEANAPSSRVLRSALGGFVDRIGRKRQTAGARRKDIIFSTAEKSMVQTVD